MNHDYVGIKTLITFLYHFNWRDKMKTNELLVSNLSITEDDYNYKGIFTLSNKDNSISVDLADLESTAKLDEIKTFFHLEDDIEIIKDTILKMVIENSSISSRIKQGENYNENTKKKDLERLANSLDMS